MTPSPKPIRLIIRPEAEIDVVDAARWYNHQRPGLGDYFLNAIESALESIVENPFRYPCLRRRPEVRRALTKRFPYRVFFIRRPDAAIVFRVLHTAMRDRAWTAGLRSLPSE